MINPFFHTPGRRFIALAALVAVVAFGWYAVQPVYPRCTIGVGSGSLVSAGTSAEEMEAVARQAYEDALADGACGPSHARFRDWIG
ncbi:hypothetical protein LUW75_01630 [Streptomyces sp. MRC013]|uniref:hypothetical protein n=1 Tax=Streptomyces sp. MRC013 TaxID=2898276 RepID=UPI00202603D6|nr:hypothetical protein [Streptomyces sp. MRC013]URM88936.1 hypothetical protein LUW75_01630 [Streptomyces sp. MRC013]